MSTDEVTYNLPASVLAMQRAIFGGSARILPRYQRQGEGQDGWLATDALSYAFLDSPVLKDEVVDEFGELEDVPEGGSWVCSSPNSPDIYKPPLGARSPHLHRDGCYGFDDRARWPQLHSAKFEYFAAIPRFSAELQILWWEPQLSACTPIPGAADQEICVLNPDVLEKFKAQVDDCCDLVWKCMETSKADEPALLVTHLIETLDRLSMGLSFRNIVQNVGELQRTCLELLGWVKFVTTFLPRTTIRSSEDKKLYDVDTSIMGAFTYSIPIAQRLFRIGVPVFLIRPSKSLPPNMNVRLSAPSKLLERSMGNGAPDIVTGEFMTTRSGPYPFPILTTKFPGVELQEALQRFSIRLSRRRPAAGGSSDGDNKENKYFSASFLPFVVYNLKKGPGSSSISMNSVADPRLIDIQAIESWDNALRRLGSGPFAKGLSGSLTGTILPPPSVFAVQKDNASSNRWVYAAGYLSVRPVYIPLVVDNALSVGQSKSFPTGQQWRNLLIGFKRHLPDPAPAVHPKATTNKRPPAPATVSSTKRRRAEVPTSNIPPPSTSNITSASTSTCTALSTPTSAPSTSIVGPTSTSSIIGATTTIGTSTPTSAAPAHRRKIHPLHESLPILNGTLTHIFWLGGQIPILSRAQVQHALSEDLMCEVRWHVHEQNFRLELLVLDQEVCPELWRAGEVDSEAVRSARKERELAIRRVFPAIENRHESFFVGKIPNVDGGLAARLCRQRVPHVLALRDIILSWPGCPETIRNVSLNTQDEFLMLGLEDLVVKEYCNRFLLQFGRLPIPPVRLPFVSLSRKSPASFYEGLFSSAAQVPHFGA